MKMISLNNGMYLFTVNRSAANCMNVFIIYNIFQQIPSLGMRLYNYSYTFSLLSWLKDTSSLEFIHSHRSVANSKNVSWFWQLIIQIVFNDKHLATQMDYLKC